jgi:hypothetical protein
MVKGKVVAPFNKIAYIHCMKQLHVVGLYNTRFGDQSTQFTIHPDFIKEARKVARRCESSREFWMHTLQNGECMIAESIFNKEARWKGGVLECVSEEWELFASESLTQAKIGLANHMLARYID